MYITTLEWLDFEIKWDKVSDKMRVWDKVMRMIDLVLVRYAEICTWYEDWQVWDEVSYIILFVLVGSWIKNRWKVSGSWRTEKL